MADKIETIEVKDETTEKVVELPKATEVKEQVGPGKKMFMVIGGILTAVAAVGFGLFKLLSRNNDEDEPASTEEPTE